MLRRIILVIFLMRSGIRGAGTNIKLIGYKASLKIRALAVFLVERLEAPPI